MCKLVELKDGVSVADIKKDYIFNIVKQAGNCDNITRIVLFGSAVEERCTNLSDIDIAVFGEKNQTEYLRSKEFKEFQRNLFMFGNDFTQDYDILYFCDNKKYDDAILADIANGAEIYRRDAV